MRRINEKERKGKMRKILCIFLFVVFIPLFVFGQEYQEGIPWGNAYFKPSLEFIYTHSDNIFRIDDSMGDKMDDNIWLIRPQIGFEFPFENSFIGFAVQYEYKDYESYNLLHHNTWAGEFKSQFRFSNDSVLTIKDHYIQGVQQTEQFDPDMEVYWSTTRFSRNQAEVGYAIPVNSLNKLNIHLIHNFVNFKGDFDSGTIPFFSYSQKSGGLSWKYNYQPLASLVFEWQHTKSEPHDDNYYYTPIGRMTTKKSYNEDRFSIGWEGDAERKLSGYAKIGYKRMNFSESTIINFDDFKGVVADAGLKLQLNEFTDLNSNIFRHADQSAFNVNNYYRSTGIDIHLHHQFSRHLFGTIGGKYQENSYPERVIYDSSYMNWALYYYLQGQKRKDDISQFLAELGYHFSERISLRLNYLYENRDSSLKFVDSYAVLRKPYSYSENRFVFQIQMGW